MRRYPEDAWERAMKVQEVILRAMAKKITWWQAAEIIGLSDRSLRHWRGRYEQFGYDGLFDRRPGRPLPRMLLHLDVSSHQWFHDDRSYELIEVLDDATSGTYWAQWVEEQSTRPVIAALPSSTDVHL